MITVITPVYNGEHYIEACLQSVIAQNCSEVEHLIMDGGSHDRTIEIIKYYADLYPHIRWISEKDRGQSDAMNKGIRLAKGEIVGFLNVDDYYEPNVLNQAIELFKTLPVPSLVVGNCNVWDDHGNLKKYNRPKHLRFTDLLLGANIHPHPINPSAYFYHACLHDTIGEYNIEEHFALDVDFILRAVQVATVKHVDLTWGNYREISGTKTVTDWQTGQGTARSAALLKRYRDQLPFLVRTQNALLYVVLNTVHDSTHLLKRGIAKIARSLK
ncbi:MAG: glycosyltransferase [Leptolyngbya sp. UWPOB_LEPTO1]|uniref:glycosyltransferase family 2 protein n=1 Tax=Leptolyngbya sp. UWPOB_LEPTO1 TaxID=2815653 RepID=UPI001AC708F5|nr:glycosyltransferase family 2 protein [Leptolyngbya sp. UWPOB_LEPTO1]MBN8563398.1 glycosyltransferase [Leptolyngbya sp. UWPOB_LEPTO1]